MVQVLLPVRIPVEQRGVDVPLASPQQAVQGARLPGGEVRPSKNTRIRVIVFSRLKSGWWTASRYRSMCRYRYPMSSGGARV